MKSDVGSVKRILRIALVLCFAAAAAAAHDFWVWPSTFRPLPGAAVTLQAGVGEEFPKFTNAVPIERIEGMRLVSPSGEQSLAACELKIGEPGAHVLALTVKPRFIELKPDQFARYITEEEFAHVIQARRQANAEQQPGREIYSRYSKLLLQAGSHGSDAPLIAPVAHELEIVPEANPARLRPGQELPVIVLFRGKPLAGQRVAAAPAGGLSKGHNFPVVTRTDSNGRARLRLDRNGPWYIRLIYMIPQKGSLEGNQADWRSFFATLTFSAGR